MGSECTYFNIELPESILLHRELVPIVLVLALLVHTTYTQRTR